MDVVDQWWEVMVSAYQHAQGICRGYQDAQGDAYLIECPLYLRMLGQPIQSERGWVLHVYSMYDREAYPLEGLIGRCLRGGIGECYYGEALHIDLSDMTEEREREWSGYVQDVSLAQVCESESDLEMLAMDTMERGVSLFGYLGPRLSQPQLYSDMFHVLERSRTRSTWTGLGSVVEGSVCPTQSYVGTVGLLTQRRE